MGIHHSHIPHFMAPRHKIPGEFFTAKDVNPDAGTCELLSGMAPDAATKFGIVSWMLEPVLRALLRR